MKIINGYPEYMMKSIKQVEKKRERNMTTPVKPMSMKDRENILKREQKRLRRLFFLLGVKTRIISEPQ